MSRIDRKIEGNVIWLTYPARDRKRSSKDRVASLKQSVEHLAQEIERSRKLRTDIEAALSVRRYELYKVSMASGERAMQRSLAAGQRLHLRSLLTFARAVTAAPSNGRAAPSERLSQFDHLASSIRRFEASLRYARELSRDVQMQSECRNWSGSTPAPGSHSLSLAISTY